MRLPCIISNTHFSDLYLLFVCVILYRCLIIFLTILSTLRIKSHLGWKFGLKRNMASKPMVYLLLGIVCLFELMLVLFAYKYRISMEVIY